MRPTPLTGLRSDIIAIISSDGRGFPVGQLIVRKVEDALIRALKVRAAEKRRSAEAEHREILREALASRRHGKTLKDLLLEMPPGGEDTDFERPRDLGRQARL